jgi:hypothetical protein
MIRAALFTSLLAILLSFLASRILRVAPIRTMSTTPSLPRTQADWRVALAALPAAPAAGIPAFYFGHGSPMLAATGDMANHPRFGDAMRDNGPDGVHAKFLRDFGPALLEKYKPRGIVVFSAHWDTKGEQLGTQMRSHRGTRSDAHSVTDYGDENPLLYDYYGFAPEVRLGPVCEL